MPEQLLTCEKKKMKCLTVFQGGSFGTGSVKKKKPSVCRHFRVVHSVPTSYWGKYHAIEKYPSNML